MLFGEGDISGVGNVLLGWILPPSTGFSPNSRFGGRIGQSIHGGGNKQDESRGNIFGKMGNAGGIIQGYNATGHCSVLRDLIQMNCLK